MGVVAVVTEAEGGTQGWTSSLTEEQQVSNVVRKWNAAKKHHDQFVRKYERMERAYRGIVEPKSKAAAWRNISNPMVGFQIIESVVANTTEEKLRFSATPTPMPGMKLDEVMHRLDQAEAVEGLIRAEHRLDNMDEKQRPLFLSDALCGMGIGATKWSYHTGPFEEQYVDYTEVYHPDEQTLIGHVPTLKTRTVEKTWKDHSTLEVVDPRDFVMHESAKTLQPTEPGGAQHCFQRCWYSMEQLRAYQAGGYLKNVEKLNLSRDQSTEYADRETRLFSILRSKDLVEVIEFYEYKGGRILRTIIGNRQVLLSEQQLSPFTKLGQSYPFVIVNSMPQLFTTQGMSTMELVYRLQDLLWFMQSQRMDNIELINNAILLIRKDIEDPEAFEWFPGARWPVTSPADVQPFQPPYQLASLTLEAEHEVKGDLQSVTSAAPFAGGVSSNVDNATATGVSITMNNAQKAMQARKFMAMKGLNREVAMRLKNCQQFITDTRLIHEIGPDGVALFREVDPIDYEGEFAFVWDENSESSMRQERRAEAMQWLQVLTGIAPLLAASQTPFDLKGLVQWAAKKWDIEDSEKFFTALPQPQVVDQGASGAGGGSQPSPGSAPVPPGGPNLGVTSETAVDASKPSATGGISASPSLFMQRAAAMGGGVANAG